MGRMDQYVSSVSGTFNALYDGVDMIAFTDTAGNVAGRYALGPGMDEPLLEYEGKGTTKRIIGGLKFGEPFCSERGMIACSLTKRSLQR